MFVRYVLCNWPLFKCAWINVMLYYVKSVTQYILYTVWTPQLTEVYLSTTLVQWDDVTQHLTSNSWSQSHSFFFFLIFSCSETPLPPSSTHPPTLHIALTLLLRLENSPALSFIYQCSLPTKENWLQREAERRITRSRDWVALSSAQTDIKKVTRN